MRKAAAARLFFKHRVGAVGVDDTPAHHRQQRDGTADLLDRHAEVVTAQHREIGELTDCERAARVLFEAEPGAALSIEAQRSEEHTSELQSQSNLVCRLLLEKKKNNHAA